MHLDLDLKQGADGGEDGSFLYKLQSLWQGSSAALFGGDTMRATCVISSLLVEKKNQKQMQLILKIYFIYPKLSFQHVINMKVIDEVLYVSFVWLSVFKI